MSASMVARATVRAVSKRKILATRAALTLTPSAVNRIRNLLEDKPEYLGLKVGVRTRGCNGMTYTLDFTKQKDQADEEVLQDVHVSKNQAMRSTEFSKTGLSRHRSGEGYQHISAALKVPKNTVASIILKLKKFRITKTLPRSGCPAKLSNRGRRALVRENLPEGQPSLHNSTNQAFIVEWPDRSHSSVGMFFSSRDWERLVRIEGKDEWSKVQRSLMKTCSRVLRTSDWGDGSSSNRTTTLNTQPRQRRNVLEWPSQNLIKHLWRDLKIAVQQSSPSNLTEFERICGECFYALSLWGVRVFIEKKAQLTLLGTEMDFVESKLSSEFVFNNPNIKGTCGCGESFNM
ncbi:unnamed protein product [Oncorhynchus mykiss]|uniref:Iron-sulfur cluster assembly 1 homolog, mitochondrial n=1 Tax=Oncorhynchus mykiss TaxID=8022 RepID=A0A060YP28_ONCMY|nr:unnamed protein product [Oncorhynchus mykiss]